MHQPCPICGDPYAGFHEENCGAAVAVPKEALVTKTAPERVRLTDEEIAQRRAEAAARKAGKDAHQAQHVG